MGVETKFVGMMDRQKCHVEPFLVGSLPRCADKITQRSPQLILPGKMPWQWYAPSCSGLVVVYDTPCDCCSMPATKVIAWEWLSVSVWTKLFWFDTWYNSRRLVTTTTKYYTKLTNVGITTKYWKCLRTMASAPMILEPPKDHPNSMAARAAHRPLTQTG